MRNPPTRSRHNRTRCALTVAALILTACSSSHTGTPSTAPTPNPTPSYLAAVRPLFPPTNTDQDLLAAGHDYCRVLAAGGGYSDLLDRIGRIVGPTRARRVIDAAVHAFCPDQTSPPGTP